MNPKPFSNKYRNNNILASINNLIVCQKKEKNIEINSDKFKNSTLLQNIILRKNQIFLDLLYFSNNKTQKLKGVLFFIF